MNCFPGHFSFFLLGFVRLVSIILGDNTVNGLLCRLNEWIKRIDDLRKRLQLLLDWRHVEISIVLA